MLVRSLIGVLFASLALSACDSRLLPTACSSAEDINPAGAALTDDIQQAESAGKIDRAKAAEAMGRIMSAGQAYEQKRDVAAFCAELAKIRKDTGV